MRGAWRDLRADGGAQRARRSRRALTDARPRERLDLALATLGVIGLLGLLAAGWLVAGVLDRNAVADPDILRPLPDSRILSNIRDSSAPYVAGAALGQDEVVLLRADGGMARVDQRTGLIRDDRYPGSDRGLTTPPVAMAATCPDPQAGAGDCAEAGAISVLSEGGGIIQGVHRLGGFAWDVLLHDGPWIGQAGRAVEQADVTSWAATAGGATTVVLAGDQGIGVHEASSGRWIVPAGQAPLLAALAEGGARLVADGARVWILTARGYGVVTGTTLEWSADTDIALLDLAIAPDGQRLAIVSGPCELGLGADCLTLARLEGLDRLMSVVGERTRQGNLDQAGLTYAMMQSGQIVTVGEAGVHAYNADDRNWRQLHAGRIDSHYASGDGALLVASGGEVRLIRSAQVDWSATVDGGPFRQVVAAGTRFLGLGEDGQVRDLGANRVLAGGEEPLPAGASFTSGASIGALVLMAGPDGALLHDVQERRFNWLAPAELNSAGSLLQPGMRLFGLSGGFVAVDPGPGTLHDISIVGDWPNLSLMTTQAAAILPGPLRSITSDGAALSMVDATGRSWRYDPGQELRPLIGNAATGAAGPFRFAAGRAEGLFLASSQTLHFYDPNTRDWSRPLPPPQGATYADLSLGEALFAATGEGTLLSLGETGWERLMGGTVAAISSEDLTDAAPQGNLVLLAGDGQVQSYDPVAGAFVRHHTGGAGAVKIVDAAYGRGPMARPVWVSDDTLFWGDDMVAADIRDAWNVRDGYLAERRGGANGQFTAFWRDLAAEPTCAFFSAPAPGGKVLDGLALDADRMLIASAQGFGIHDAASRRWITLDLPPLAADERLVFAADMVAAVGRNGFRALPRSGINPINSCATPLIKRSWTYGLVGRATAFDPGSGKIAVLEADGAVKEWVNATVGDVQSNTGTQPDPATFRTAALAGKDVLFATEHGIWTYDTHDRTWRSSRFDMSPGPIASLSFASTGAGRVTLSVWTEDGRSLAAEYRTAGAPLTLTPLRPIHTPVIPLDPAGMTDFSMRNGVWAFGSGGRVAFGSSSGDRLSAILTLSEGEAATPFTWGDTLAFKAGDSDAPDWLTILPRDTSLEALSGTSRQAGFIYAPRSDRAYGLGATGRELWRIDESGRVLSCDIRAGGSSVAGCKERLAAPIVLSPSDLRFAWQGGGFQYIVMGDSLNTLDRAWRNLTPVAGPTFGDESLILDFAGLTLMLEQPGGALWRITGGQAKKLAGQVRQMRVVGRRLALESDGKLVWLKADGTMEMPAATNGTSALSFDWISGAAYSVSPTGQIVDDAGRPLSTLSVPSPDTIAQVLKAPDGSFVVQRSTGTVEQLVETGCDTGHREGQAVPCLDSGRRLPIRDRGLGRLSGVAANGDGLTLHFERGTLRLDPDGQLENPSNPVGPAETVLSYRGSAQLQVNTHDLQAAIETVNGRSELAPASIANAGLSSRTVTAELAAAPTRWSALDLGWMRWNRDNRQFLFDAVGGRLEVSPQRAIVEGQIIASRPGRAVPLDAGAKGGYAWRSGEALWRYQGGTAGPQLVNLAPRPEALGQSGQVYLLAGNSGEDTDGAATGPVAQSTRLSVGDLSLALDAPRQSVTASISRLGGPDLPAFASAGFQHDDRRGVAYIDGNLVTITPVGLVPAPGPLTGTEALPAQIIPRRILAERGSSAELPDGTWQVRRGPGSWAQASSPLVSRDLGQTAARRWSLTEAGLDVSAAEAWLEARNGLDFAADRFLSVAGTPDHVVVATALGTHSVAGGGDVAGIGAAQAAVPSLPLVVHASQPLQPRIFEATGAQRQWDASGGWVAPGGTPPWVEGVAAATRWLRVDLRGGRLYVARLVSAPDGTQLWADFSWSRMQRFPFDRTRVIEAAADALWIGTDMGLRRFAADGSPSAELFDLNTGGSVPDAVVRLGRPAGNPEMILALSSSGACVQATGSGVAATCLAGETLERRFVLSSALWSWVQTDAGPAGSYPTITTTGTRGTMPVRLTAGNLWLHDDLRGWASCGAVQAELWSGSDILRRDGINVVLPADAGRGDLHCQPRASELGASERLEAGLYLVSESPWQSLGAARLQPLSTLQAGALRDRAAGGMAFDGGRLRLRTGPVESGWEHRTAADAWRSLAWEGNLPALDQTRGIAVLDSTLFRITPAGVVGGDPRPGRLAIDPDRLLLAVTDRFDGLSGCQPLTIDVANGVQHAVPPRGTDRLLIGCRGGETLMGEPGGRDLGAFKPAPSELFSPRTLVDEEEWLWVADRLDLSAAPVLTAKFQGEPMSVSAGRFPIDSFISVATPFAGRVDLVGSDGWRVYRGGLGLRAGARPEGHETARSVIAVTADRGASGEAGDDPVLCTADSSGAVLHSSKAALRSAETCQRWQGQAGVWSYRDRLQGAPEALGQATNGPLMQREIGGGRFLDLTAIGVARRVRDRLFVPTVVGALSFNRAGVVDAYYKLEDPRGLYIDGDGAPVAITTDGREALDPASPPMAGCGALANLMSAGDVVMTEVSLQDSALQASLISPKRKPARKLTLDCAADAAEDHRRDLSVEDRARYQAQLRPLQDATGTIRVQHAEGGRLLVSDARSRSASLSPPAGSGALLEIFPSHDGRSFMTVFEREVLELDVDAAVSLLAGVAPSRVPPTPLTTSQSGKDEAAAKPSAQGAGPGSATPVEPVTPVAPVPQDAPVPPVAPPAKTLPPAAPAAEKAPAAGADAPPPAQDRHPEETLPYVSLKPGEIREIQGALKALGLYALRVDGIAGPGTERAVRAYQGRIGAEETGVLSSAQRDKLLSEGG